MALTLINTDRRYRPAELIEAAPNGHLHIAAQIDPPSTPGPVRATPKTRDTLLLLAPHLAQLSRRPGIASVQLFRAAAFPSTTMLPASDQCTRAAVVYDMAILIKTARPADLEAAKHDPAYLELLDILHTRSRHIVLTPARNVRRIAAVPASDRLHLFDHFLSDAAGVPELWEHLAGSYQQEMGLTNSELIAPLAPETTPCAFINHASSNLPLAQFVERLSRHREFQHLALTHLDGNAFGALPSLYRPIPYQLLADAPHPASGDIANAEPTTDRRSATQTEEL
jgi:hypothetical protein